MYIISILSNNYMYKLLFRLKFRLKFKIACAILKDNIELP